MSRKKTPAQIAREIADHVGPRILNITGGESMADRRVYNVVVQYPGESSKNIGFAGPASGTGPVVMITQRGQVFVTDPSRFGKFGRDWIRRFFEAS